MIVHLKAYKFAQDAYITHAHNEQETRVLMQAKPRCAKFVCFRQGRSQEFVTGDKKHKRGGLGTEVPQRGTGAEPRWGLGRSPQKSETNANFQLRRGTCSHAPLATSLVSADIDK